jgi:YHS domain-containing protein
MASARDQKKAQPGAAKAADTQAITKPQTSCPIMGFSINKKYYVDYRGKRIYVCCKECLAQVKKDPESALRTLRSLGQEPETLVTTVRDKTNNVLAPVNADSIKTLDSTARKKNGDSSNAGSRGVLQQ